MPTVLLTGSSGLVERVARPALAAAGWTVRPFDLDEAWTRRTAIPTIVLRPVMVLTERLLTGMRPEDAELGAFVHVDDVAAAVAALAAELTARRVLGWRATRGWPAAPP